MNKSEPRLSVRQKTRWIFTIFFLITFTFLMLVLLRGGSGRSPEFNELSVVSGTYISYRSTIGIVIQEGIVPRQLMCDTKFCGGFNWGAIKDGTPARAWVTPGGSIYQLEIDGVVRVSYQHIVHQVKFWRTVLLSCSAICLVIIVLLKPRK